MTTSLKALLLTVGLSTICAACITGPPDELPNSGTSPDAGQIQDVGDDASVIDEDARLDAGSDAADSSTCVDPGPHRAALILFPTGTTQSQVSALPVPVVIKDDASLAAIFDDAETVWFTDPVSEAVLAHEVVAIDRDAGTVEAWVEWPNFVTTDGGEIVMHVGDAQFRGVSPAMWSDFAGVWHFTPASTGQRFQDSSPNSNDGSAPKGATLAAGAIGSSGVFDSSSEQYVSIDDSASLRVDEFTFSAWVKLDSLLERQAFMQKVLFTNGTVRRSYGFELDTEGIMYGFATPTGSVTYNTFRNLEQSPRFQAGEWHHVVYTRNDAGDGVWLYLDGQQVHSQAFNGPIEFDEGPLLLAAGQNDNGIRQFLGGQLDEVHLSSKWHSPEWVAASHAVQAGGLLQLGEFVSDSGACD